MALKPLTCQPRHLVKGTRLFEEMCRSRDDHELLFAAELRERYLVQFNYLDIVAADDKQRRRTYAGQCRSRQIGPPAARYDRAHLIRTLGGCNQRGSSAGAGTEVADQKVVGVGELSEPVGRVHEPFGEQFDVEAQLCRTRIDCFFVERQQIDQQRRQICFIQHPRHMTIARAMPTTSAARQAAPHPATVIAIRDTLFVEPDVTNDAS